jgi:hypothetical protein
VPTIQLRPEVLFALTILVAAIAIGVLGRVAGASARIHLWYWSHTLLGLSVCVFGVAALMWNSRTPMLQSFATIEKVGIQTTGRGSELTNLLVRLPSGQTASLNASGRNDLFRPGQHIEAHYRQYTGAIDWVRFYDASGAQQAEFRTHTWIFPYLLFGLGIVQIASARRRFIQKRNTSMQQI